MSTVTKDTTRRARYAYTPGAPGQVQAVVHESFASNAWQATDTGTRVYDGFERLTSIGWTTGTGNNQATVASFAYLYNTANERTRTTLADGSYWQYVYDDLGQVSSGKRYSSTGAPIPGQQFEYTFDDIGNRTQAKAGGDASGNNLRTANYTSNLLNMYTGRGSPGIVDIMGYAPMASYPVSITTGGNTVPADFRLLEYYQKKVSWTNTAAARFEQVLVESDPTHAGTEKELWVFLPKDPEAFTHDVDGNLLQDGRWTYGWDGENRLIWMESRTDLPTAMPRQRVEFGYDFMSRRNVKRMYIPVAVAEIPGGPLDEPQTVGSTTSVIDGATASVSGPGSDAAPETLPAWAVSAPVGWSQVGLSKYVWDGWNLLAELDITDASVRTFAWGLDLSGSEQGAGGIGGLVLGWTRANGSLGGEVNGTGGNTLRYVFDGNGNVMAALDDLGRVRAKYEYGPFGETLTSEGDLAADNPIRWSTKYTDGESGLVYYGYRYYNAGTGRWLNRDPIEEAGGAALFAFAINAPLTYFDMLGTDFIAVADRPVKGTGGLAYHYSLQYWKADCNPSVGAVLDVSKVRGGKKAESVELLADDGWQVYRWQTSPLQFVVSGQWVLTDVAISTIHYSDSGDRLVPIYASFWPDEVSKRWKFMISQAKAYEYAEQPLPAGATTRTVWRNWPQSEYRIGDIYNNSNTFVREVVSRAQLQMLELPGRHQGRKTAVRVPPPYKYGTTPFRGKPPAMPIGDGGAVGVGYE